MKKEQYADKFLLSKYLKDSKGLYKPILIIDVDEDKNEMTVLYGGNGHDKWNLSHVEIALENMDYKLIEDDEVLTFTRRFIKNVHNVDINVEINHFSSVEGSFRICSRDELGNVIEDKEYIPTTYQLQIYIRSLLTKLNKNG